MITVYGLKVSYFTGKLESYLRFKEIPYQFSVLTNREFTRLLPEKTGAMQMPAVQLDDGRWMTDSTPMIDWFESNYPDHPILPNDPVQAFFCRLIEDYADEWQWRPAMHFRWSYRESSKLLARQLAATIGRDIRAPKMLIRQGVGNRQRKYFVRKDGVNAQTRDHVEQSYYRLLGFMREVLAQRPYVFGNRPTLADFGLFGPLFRHYANDPVPSRIMREDWPEVMEWVYRMWNARASRISGDLVVGIPEDVARFGREIAETHLEALCANAKATARGKKLHNPLIQRVQYRDVPTSQYRVWCLEELQRHHAESSEHSHRALDEALADCGVLEPLLRLKNVNSGYNLSKTAPFGTSTSVFEHVKQL